MDVTYINSTNETNNISMNDDDNVSQNSMHLFIFEQPIKGI